MSGKTHGTEAEEDEEEMDLARGLKMSMLNTTCVPNV